MTQPAEGVEPGHVVDVIQRGYRIGDVVLRPARVIVAEG
jgi:molecular chaperone GrpE (heat shock protein)